MKILILINNDVGLYKFRKEFLEELLKNYEVFISSPRGPFTQKVINMGCHFIETDINRRGTNPFADIKLMLRYHKIVQKINPDLIYTYTIKPNVYGGLIAMISKTPYIATITGLGTAVQKNGWLQKFVTNLYKVSLKKASRVFFQNSDNLKFFQENKIIKDNQIRLVPGSGVNLTHYQYQKYPIDSQKINFLFVGRLMVEKGINELFEAAEYFKNKESKISFHILGFMEDNLDGRLKELITNGTIIYHGQQSDIRPFLKDAHAIIHPSYHEGLSNVLLEAAASGRPILASDIPGCQETFDEGSTGYGFSPKSTESLINVIEKFINLPHDQKEQMGVLGRKKIEKEFDRDQVVQSYINEVNKLK